MYSAVYAKMIKCCNFLKEIAILNADFFSFQRFFLSFLYTVGMVQNVIDIRVSPSTL